MTRPAGARIDHYELVEHLGHGAQAEVHRAKDVASGEEVVLKFPHARTLDHPALAARWRREAALTEGLSHVHIQCRRDAGERHREPYLVLEYASGGSLEGWIGADPLPIAQVVEWGRQLALALAFLHERDIAHRDVKPGNVLIDQELRVKLADFGAAVRTTKRRRSVLTPPPITEGTPQYLSPEQAAGQTGDARSDVYSWGVVMYELLTGRAPFTGTDISSTMSARLTEMPDPLRQLRPDVPAGLEVIITTALRRFPERRYADARALLADLDRVEDIDPADYDLSPDPPFRADPSETEAAAVLRLALLVAGGFVAVVTIIIALSVALR